MNQIPFSHPSKSTTVIVTGLVVVIALGLIGWTVRHDGRLWRRGAGRQVATNGSATEPKQKAAPDPYAGWKSYCDANYKLCFKYPPTWHFTATSEQITVLSPLNSVEIDYIAPYIHDNNIRSFLPTAIATVAGSNSVKIVGGVYLPAHDAQYNTVDTSLLTHYPLTIGRPTAFPGAPHFSDPTVALAPDVAFRARTTSPTLSQAQAQAWFNSPDGATSLQILRSLSMVS